MGHTAEVPVRKGVKVKNNNSYSTSTVQSIVQLWHYYMSKCMYMYMYMHAQFFVVVVVLVMNILWYIYSRLTK